jgi:hypothetical protein
MQAAQLQYDKEQADYTRQAFFQEVLQVLQRSYGAQGNQVGSGIKPGPAIQRERISVDFPDRAVE